MSRPGRMVWLVLAMALGVAGCGPFGWTRVTVNHPLKADEVTFITPGKTTLDEVTKRLGAPAVLEETPAGVVANYYYYDGRYFSVDFGYPLNFVGPVSVAPHSMVLRNLGVGLDMFQVAYDSRWVVEYDGFAHRGDVSKYTAWPFESHLP